MPGCGLSSPDEMGSPTTDDLASVVAIVIASDRDAENIGEETGIPLETVQVAIAELLRRGLLRGRGDGLFHATQSLCVGPCSRGGSGMLGQEVVINATTLRWMCAVCWAGHEDPKGSAAEVRN